MRKKSIEADLKPRRIGSIGVVWFAQVVDLWRNCVAQIAVTGSIDGQNGAEFRP